MFRRVVEVEPRKDPSGLSGCEGLIKRGRFAVGMMLVSVTRFVTHIVQTLAQLSATLSTVTSTLAELHQHMVADQCAGQQLQRPSAKNEQAFQKVLLRLELLVGLERAVSGQILNGGPAARYSTGSRRPKSTSNGSFRSLPPRSTA